MQIRPLSIIVFILLSISSRAYGIALLYSCNFGTIGSMNFGNVPGSLSNPISTSTLISVTCTNLLSLGATNVSYTITASPGTSTDQLNRKLALLTDRASYNIYIDSGNSTIFGNGTSPTGTFTMSYSINALASRTDNFRIYGLMPVQNISSLGIYTDNITLTLTY